MTYRSDIVTTPDGRQLEVASVGDPAGKTLFFHHGTPGSAPLVKMFDNLANERGYFVVTTSRAGYGHSSRLAGRAIGDVVGDVTVALDHHARGEYFAMGWSGGGPHALAGAALDAPRCRGAISLAGVAPRTDSFSWTDGMAESNVAEFELAVQGGEEYESHIKASSVAARNLGPEGVVAMLGDLLSPVDLSALKDDAVRATLAEAFRHGASGGHFGFLDDDQAFLVPWGFDLTDLHGSIEIWFGDQDLMVPPTHGHYLLSSIDGSVGFHRPDEGHVSIVTKNLDELFNHLDQVALSR